MDEVGAKTAQSRTDMAPVELKLATSWPQDCMKADISHECIKHTNSLGKTMIYYIPHGQFASKMAQIRAKIRFKSVPSRVKPSPIQSNPFQTDPRPIQSDPIPHPDRSMATPGRIRMVTPGRKSSELIRNDPKSSEIIANHPNANRLVYPLVNPSV